MKPGNVSPLVNIVTPIQHPVSKTHIYSRSNSSKNRHHTFTSSRHNYRHPSNRNLLRKFVGSAWSNSRNSRRHRNILRPASTFVDVGTKGYRGAATFICSSPSHLKH